MRSGRLQVRPRSSDLRCVVCHAVMRHPTVATCAGCGVVAHRGCARALATCPSLGCTAALVAPPGPRASVRRRPAFAHAVLIVALAAAALACAAESTRAPRVRAAAAAAPAPPALAPPAPPVVASGLLSSDPIERGEAALALGRVFCFSSSPEARTRAVEALLATAARDPEPSVRARCDAAFADDDDGCARVHLERALEHDDPDVRLVAADVLGRVSARWSRTALLARVDPRREPDARVRAVAAARLLLIHPATRVNGAVVLDALERRVADEPDSLVWVILRAGLNEHRRDSEALVTRTLPVLISAAARADDRVSAACRDLLSSFGRVDQGALLDTLGGDDAPARALAATLLGRWIERPGGCIDRPGLRAALTRARSDPDADVRLAASSALAAAEGTMVRRALSYESHCRTLDPGVPTAPPATRRSGR